MVEYVVVLPFPVDTNLNRLPLVLKKKPPHLVGMLNLPGGKIDANENPMDTAVRELKEETGLEEIQEYDGICYLPPIHLGVIQGNNSIIHCVRVPICSRQELNPGPAEIEEIKWYSFPDLLNLQNLMPNLRVIIPLMIKGFSDWKIKDFHDWRGKRYHTIGLYFKDMENNPITISVKSDGYYEEE